MNSLPESCVAEILSLMSPAEACRLALISSTFRSAAESDIVWGRFLPSDHADLISSSPVANSDTFPPLRLASKKGLFLRLCQPTLIHDGKRSLKLERSSARISYMLSARELSIHQSEDPAHWIWTSMPESRFKEVAVLRTTNWLEIEGAINTRALSPNTPYGAYIVFKVSDRAYGLDLVPSETSIKMSDLVISRNTAHLHSPNGRKKLMESLFHGHRTEMLAKLWKTEGECRVPSEREDGWMEVEIGEFFSPGGGGDEKEEVKMSLREAKGYQLKGGLIFEGIEVRPKGTC